MMYELKDTVAPMLSESCKERFRAEYYQVKIRQRKLDRMIRRYEIGTLDFEPTCPIGLLHQQSRQMVAYMLTLQERAELEGIDLDTE